LERFALQDIIDGEGLIFIDPKGTSAEKLLTMVPPKPAPDVIYFNVSDPDFAFKFNPIDNVPLEQQPRAASAFVGAIKSLFPDGFGANLNLLLRNAIQAIQGFPGHGNRDRGLPDADQRQLHARGYRTHGQRLHQEVLEEGIHAPLVPARPAREDPPARSTRSSS